MKLTCACPDKFPMEQYIKLTHGELLKDPVKYKRLVEQLIYLMVNTYRSTETSLGCRNSSSKVHDHQDKDCYCHPKTI